MDSNKENLFYTWILFAFVQSEKGKWNEYRDKALELDDSVVKELEDYFEKIFKDTIPQYALPIKTPLYRARQIKSYEWDQVGVNISRLEEEYYKMLLAESDIEIVNSPDSLISYQTAGLLKILFQQKINEKQMDKLIEFNKRYSEPNNFYGFSKSDCGVPPEKFRHNGRLNTKTDAYLYLAFDKDTAIYEMRPSIGQSYSLATCKSNKDLLLVDLRSAQMITDYNYFLVYSLAEKISDPNTDNDERFYHITQCLSHFLQNKKYDGIIYTSAINKAGINVMLFDEKDVDILSSEILSINNITINYTTQFPFNSNDWTVFDEKGENN